MNSPLIFLGVNRSKPALSSNEFQNLTTAKNLIGNFLYTDSSSNIIEAAYCCVLVLHSFNNSLITTSKYPVYFSVATIAIYSAE